MPFDENIFLGILILLIFCIGAALMFTRKMPALLVLPIMALAIAGSAAVLKPEISFVDDLFAGVIGEGALRLHKAIIIAFFGGILSFMMQKSGVAESLIKNAAELIGDNPLGVSMFCLAVISLLFTSLGGLGAIIMVAIVFLPMMATVGIPPIVAGGIMLLGISIGGIMNAGNWVLYTESLGVNVSYVKRFAVTVAVLMFVAGTAFICVELFRAGAVRSKRSIFLTFGTAVLAATLFVWGWMISGAGEGAQKFEWKIFSPDFREYVEIRQDDPVLQFTQDGDTAAYEIDPESENAVPLLTISPQNPGGQSENYRTFLPDNPLAYRGIELPVKSTEPIRIRMSMVTSDGQIIPSAEQDQIERTIDPFTGETILFRFSEFEGFAPEEFNGLVLSALPPAEDEEESVEQSMEEAEGEDTDPAQTVLDEGVAAAAEDQLPPLPVQLRLGSMSFVPAESTSIFTLALRTVVGIFFIYVLTLILLDLRTRIRRWRQQVVEIKWYSYLIPVVPLVLILLFNVDILAAFFISFVYAILVTLRPGSMSMTIQCMIQGSSAVMPAALLMIGIGIMLTAVMGPSGWEAAHGGQTWPVGAAIEPIFLAITPTSPMMYVVVFGLLAPLALYRGPLNIWGLGFGVSSLFLIPLEPVLGTTTAAAAVMGMLMTVGQVQGVCDPTNTWNVWLANELRVDVQSLMWRTLPYVWIMVFIGLAVSAVQVFDVF